MKQITTLFLLLLPGAFLFAQQFTLQENWPKVNGMINAMVHDTFSNVVYVGGNFTSVNPNLSYGTRLNITTYEPDYQIARPNESVFTSIPDGVGGWYIGGAFTQVGDSIRNGLAHIDAAGSLTPWSPNVNGDVSELKLVENTLYVVGSFLSINGFSRKNAASFDITTGTLTAWNPNASSSVRCIEVSGTTVYLGGFFSNIGGQSRNKIAAVDAVTGAVLSWNPNANGAVSTMLMIDTILYVGGTFTTIGGQTRNYLAALDNQTALPTSWAPNPNSGLNIVAAEGSTLYVGGIFTSIGGQPRNKIAAFDLSSGLLTSWNPDAGVGTGIAVIDILPHGQSVYLAGSFNTVGGVTHESFAQVDAITGNAAEIDMNAEGGIHTLSISGDELYIGGWFLSFGGPARNGLAAFDATTGILTSWNPEMNYDGTVYSMVINGQTLYVSGIFTSVGGQSRSNIAAIGPDGSILSWNPGANAYANSMVISDNLLYAVGGFTLIGGEVRNRAAALDLLTGITTSWNPNADNEIYTIEIAGSTIYLGGIFSNLGGETRSAIAAVDKTSGALLPWNVNLLSTGSMEGLRIKGLHCLGDTLYIGGGFNFVNNIPRRCLAAVSSTNGSLLDWNPNLQISGNWTLNYGIWDIVPLGDNLYIPGNFSSIGDQIHNNYVILNAVTGIPNSWSQTFPGPTLATLPLSNSLWIAGYATSVNDTYVGGVAVFGICYPTTSETSITNPCNYTWNGNLYHTSGTYTDTLVNANGCDSVAVLHLTITNSATSVDQSFCESYDWNGTIYTTSGIYTQSFTNIYGCDSIVTLNLINQISFATQNESACETFIWPLNGETYITSGVYVDTITNTVDCDSIVTLNLTIYEPIESTEVQETCGYFTWIDGNTYTESATATHVFEGAASTGCDSIVTLILTISLPSTTINKTVSNSYFWPLSNQTYTESGTYTDTIVNSTGCDTIVTLNLTITTLTVNIFSAPSYLDDCTGIAYVSALENPSFTFDIGDGNPVISTDGNAIITDLCPGIYSLLTTDGNGDTLNSSFVIPAETNYILINPLGDGIDSLSVITENCDIDYQTIDTAYIDSYTVLSNDSILVIWVIVGANTTTSIQAIYPLNESEGNYYLQLQLYCPGKSIGNYFVITHGISYLNGNIYTVGIKENESSNISLFPNPASDKITIRFEENEGALTIRDINGKALLSKTVASNGQVDISAFAAGIYLFDISTEKGTIVKRVVKN